MQIFFFFFFTVQPVNELMFVIPVLFHRFCKLQTPLIWPQVVLSKFVIELKFVATGA